MIILFLTHPEQKYYQTQLIRDFEFPSSLVQSELKKLTAAGILNSEKEANIRYFRVNKSFPIYSELKSIVYKTVALADPMREALEKIGDIKIAFIYGSVAKDTENMGSDIDLMVIGNPSMDELATAVTKAEKGLSREINFTVFEPADWKKNLKEKKGFATTVFKDKKIFLMGTEDELRKIS
ncbi:MAG: nucleotidyltransferase domain-containing protein [Thermoleophilia bacterium]